MADHGQFYVRVRGPVGTRIEVMSDKVAEISKHIDEMLPKDSVKTILANTGVLPSWAAAYSPNSASHDSLIEVELERGRADFGTRCHREAETGFHASLSGL